VSSIGRLDALPIDEAVATLAPLFEGAPRFLVRLASDRPFGSWTALFARAREITRAMPEPEQLELVDAHPRLGASRHAVSTLSAREQGRHRDDPDPAVAASLAALNDAYEARFGFRYCVFVAGRPLAALVPELELALQSDRTSELRRALDAVIDIASARQAVLDAVIDAVSPPDPIGG
jgi:2-oxo-4-hydroxy-4-carboxy--5-ureidoimidazoline (OHCU) decarboxylase